jgi:hypothetical protein
MRVWLISIPRFPLSVWIVKYLWINITRTVSTLVGLHVREYYPYFTTITDTTHPSGLCPSPVTGVDVYRVREGLGLISMVSTFYD